MEMNGSGIRSRKYLRAMYKREPPGALPKLERDGASRADNGNGARRRSTRAVRLNKPRGNFVRYFANSANLSRGPTKLYGDGPFVCTRTSETGTARALRFKAGSSFKRGDTGMGYVIIELQRYNRDSTGQRAAITLS